MIERDGVERVYNDLKHARKIKGTDVYSGGEYLFVKGVMMCRLGNVKRVRLCHTVNEIEQNPDHYRHRRELPYHTYRNARSRGKEHFRDDYYRINADVRDEFGAYTVTLQNVAHLGKDGRKARLGEIRDELRKLGRVDTKPNTRIFD